MQQFNTNQPNISPPNSGTLQGVFNSAFFASMKALNTCMPAKIINYDRASNRAQVQVMINTVMTNNQQIAGIQVSSIPVMISGGGGFMINLPLQSGDLGWIIATDRDMSLFLQNYDASAPGVFILRDFGSSFFIPDLMQDFTVASEDANNAVMQNRSGTVKISLSETEITISAPTVNIMGQENSTINYIAPTGGNLYVNGNIQASGSITPDVPPP